MARGNGHLPLGDVEYWRGGMDISRWEMWNIGAGGMDISRWEMWIIGAEGYSPKPLTGFIDACAVMNRTS